jgi:putative DNA methylase
MMRVRTPSRSKIDPSPRQARSSSPNGRPLLSHLRKLDTESVDITARMETRRREVALPPIAVYRWWARRTEAVNGAIIQASSNSGNPLLICDPFAGGGVIVLSSLLKGHRVYAQDINPWATRGLRAMLTLPPGDDIEQIQSALHESIRPVLAEAYGTQLRDGSPAEIAHTFRVAVTRCSRCDETAKLFPHAHVSLTKRRDRGGQEAWLACPVGHLSIHELGRQVSCPDCSMKIDPTADYTPRRRVTCHSCSAIETLEDRLSEAGWTWEIGLVERVAGRHRELDAPTPREIAQAAEDRWVLSTELPLIGPGEELRVLTRHGFSRWSDLYPGRQRYVLEQLLAHVKRLDLSPQLSEVLRFAIWGAAEMAGYLSRWDRWYLKSYESMAGHRFNFTTLAVEPNVWGTPASGRGTVRRRLMRFIRASEWLSDKVADGWEVEGPEAATRRRRPLKKRIVARIVEGSSERLTLPNDCIDLVLTDPPYHDDVHYDELSILFRVWAGLNIERLVAEAVAGRAVSPDEDDSLTNYRELLTNIFREVARVLKPEGHLILSFANRDPHAWTDCFSALQTAGFRALGYAIVHAENETDQAKRDRRSCTLDLIMDLVADQNAPVRRWHPRPPSRPSTEYQYLDRIAQTFLEVGKLHDGWEKGFRMQLARHPFLQ